MGLNIDNRPRFSFLYGYLVEGIGLVSLYFHREQSTLLYKVFARDKAVYVLGSIVYIKVGKEA